MTKKLNYKSFKKNSATNFIFNNKQFRIDTYRTEIESFGEDFKFHV